MSLTLVDGDLPAGLTAELRAASAVAVDTETTGLSWATDELQLCQLFTPATGPVLLRNVHSDPSRLAGLLLDDSVRKIFHFAPFDLRFLASRWNVSVRSVGCTKAASKILDPELPPEAHSLQALLERHLGVVVSKGAVRTSDWGADALSVEQRDYAAKDVAHLLDLHDVLWTGLKERGLAELYERVCDYMPVAARLATAGVPDPLTY